MDEKLKELKLKLELEPNNTEYLKEISRLLFKRDLSTETEPYLLKIIEVEPDNYFASSNLGAFYLSKKEYDKAVSHLKRAISVKPDVANTYLNLALTYEGMQKSKEECIPLLRKAKELSIQTIKDGQDTGSTHFDLVHIYQFVENDLEKAAEHNKLMVEKSEDDVFLLTQAGIFEMIALNNLDQAEEYFLKAFELYPESAQVNYELGYLYYQMKKPEKSRKFYLNAVKTKPGHFYANINLGRLYHYDFGDFNKAESYYKKAIKYNPELSDTDVFLNNSMGELYYDYCQEDVAKLYFQKVLKIDSENTTALEYLIHIFEEKGDKDNARIYLERLETIQTKQKNI